MLDKESLQENLLVDGNYKNVLCRLFMIEQEI